MSSDPDDPSYYTITGTLFFGPDPPKTLPGSSKSNVRVVKEDVWIKDLTGQIEIRLWEPLLSVLKDKGTYQLSHIKLKKFQSSTYCTTSPYTIHQSAEPRIDVRKDAAVTNDVSVKITEFDSFGEVVCQLSCLSCCKTVDMPEIGKKTVKCSHCKTTAWVEKLLKKIVVEINILLEDEKVKLYVYTDVLSEVLQKLGKSLNEDDDDIIDMLLELKNITILYNRQTFILKELKFDLK